MRLYIRCKASLTAKPVWSGLADSHRRVRATSVASLDPITMNATEVESTRRAGDYLNTMFFTSSLLPSTNQAPSSPAMLRGCDVGP
jgi:hypothetical protein